METSSLPQTVLPHLSASHIEQVQDIMNETFNAHAPRHLFVEESSRVILHLAQLGHAVLVGCASNIITAKLPGGIHMRLISPLENRVEHIQEYYPMSEKEAREYIFAEEGNRKDYLKKYFEKDVEDPLFYNLVINVDILQPKDIIQIVGDLILKRFHLR